MSRTYKPPYLSYNSWINLQTKCSQNEGNIYRWFTMRLFVTCCGQVDLRKYQHSKYIKGPFTPAIYKPWTIRLVMCFTVLSGHIHTCDWSTFAGHEKFSNGLYTHFSRLYKFESSRNSSRLMNRRYERTLTLINNSGDKTSEYKHTSSYQHSTSNHDVTDV